MVDSNKITKKQARKIAYGQIYDLIEAQICQGWYDNFLFNGEFRESQEEIDKVIVEVSDIMKSIRKKAAL